MSSVGGARTAFCLDLISTVLLFCSVECSLDGDALLGEEEELSETKDSLLCFTEGKKSDHSLRLLGRSSFSVPIFKVAVSCGLGEG